MAAKGVIHRINLLASIVLPLSVQFDLSSKASQHLLGKILPSLDQGVGELTSWFDLR